MTDLVLNLLKIYYNWLQCVAPILHSFSCGGTMNIEKTKSFISNFWDKEIIPNLVGICKDTL